MQRCRITSIVGCLSLLALAVAAQTPRTAQDCFKRGLARYQKGDYAGALEEYTRAIELSSRLDQPRSDDDPRANILSREAIRFSNVRVLDPATALAYANRGLTRYQLADYEGALQDCNRALAIQPRLTEAFNNRGMVWYARKVYDRAVRDLDRAIVLSPREPEPYNNRGGVRMELNDYGSAK
jgi:tetratricopeptide (TPR) repeat protein